MRTALELPATSLNSYERTLVEQVRTHGWRSTTVASETEPSFTYSTGFWLTLDRPEVIVFDFPGELAHDVFGQLFRELKRGRDLRAGEPIAGILGGEKIYLLPVKPDAAAEHLRSTRWFYREAEFPCLQLIWPDEAGRFPWEDGFDEKLAGLQPDLTARGWMSEVRG